jgi:ribosomal protein S18 acetylase RimI-like enzyme
MDEPRYALRAANPEDYDPIASVVNEWWGRAVLPALPRLFLDHFHRTSFVAESTESRALAGFLIGLLSPSQPEEAYIHFVGVAPGARRSGLARTLYERFFELAGRDGRTMVHAVTAPVNKGSIAFHRSMGFAVRGPLSGYNGPGRSLMVFERTLVRREMS